MLGGARPEVFRRAHGGEGVRPVGTRVAAHVSVCRVGAPVRHDDVSDEYVRCRVGSCSAGDDLKVQPPLCVISCMTMLVYLFFLMGLSHSTWQ